MLRLDIGKPAVQWHPCPKYWSSVKTAHPSDAAHSATRTLRGNTQKFEQQDDLRALSLRHLPIVLVCLLPRLTVSHFRSLPAELVQVRSNRADVVQAVGQSDRRGSRPKAQYGNVGRFGSLVGDRNGAITQSSVGDCICDEIG